MGRNRSRGILNETVLCGRFTVLADERKDFLVSENETGADNSETILLHLDIIISQVFLSSSS